MADPYPGMITAVAFDYAPKGFAICDGSLLQIKQNTVLYALIGTTFGGDGITTFALPDLRSRATIAITQNSSKYRPGDKLGAETIKLDVTQLPAHTHNAIAAKLSGNQTSPSGNMWASGSGAVFPATNLYGTPSTQPPATPTPLNYAALATIGGGQPHDNMSPYIALNYVIALQGTFPPHP